MASEGIPPWFIDRVPSPSLDAAALEQAYGKLQRRGARVDAWRVVTPGADDPEPRQAM